MSAGALVKHKLELLVSVVVFASLASFSLLHSRQDELARHESAYNTIYVTRRDGLVTMSFGKNRRLWTESVYDPANDRALPVEYTRTMTVGVAYAATLRSVLEIGLGGGRTSWYLHRHLPGVEVTSVELDPAVIALARAHFGVRDEAGFHAVSGDGRLFLARSAQTWDLLLVDAYRGPFVPFHLVTREFYDLARQHLAPGGVLVQNVEPSTMLYDAALATLRAVFAQLDLYAVDGNVVAVAYDGPARSPAALLDAARARQQRAGFLYPLPELLARRTIASGPPRAQPLTDDFAPVDALRAIERHNRPAPGRESKP